MLTPWNDPESSFAQRPIPPSVYEHSVIIEVQLRQKTIRDLKGKAGSNASTSYIRWPMHMLSGSRLHAEPPAEQCSELEELNNI